MLRNTNNSDKTSLRQNTQMKSKKNSNKIIIHKNKINSNKTIEAWTDHALETDLKEGSIKTDE